MGTTKKVKFTKEQLRAIYEVCSRKDLTGNWNKIADILNARFGLSLSESAYRKKYQSYETMKDACRDIDSSVNGECTELEIQKRELERAKIQFRDERNAWQRQNYNSARVEQKLDYLESVIKETINSSHKVIKPIKIDNKSETMIVCLSDLHIGACYNNTFGEYNSDIAELRLSEYLSRAIAIGVKNNIQDVVVLGMGDLVSGIIHKSIQVTNRENVIQQIIKASEMITEFIGELTEYFNVRFINVSGNHSRIDTKQDAIKDERLDCLIGWYVKNMLTSNPNFEYVEPVDSTLGFVEIQGNIYYVCHGDYDVFGKAGVANLVLATGIKPKGIFYGHLHTSRMEDCADIRCIQSGSLGGSGDDYTVEKRLTGKPSQTICIADAEGINCIYPVVLH